MSFAQKLLHCNNCKKDFIFTIEEQERRSYQGYPNDPLTCPTCRRARKTNSSKQTDADGSFSPNLQTFLVVCTQCGKAVRVPFQPSSGRPVYCNECQMRTRFGK